MLYSKEKNKKRLYIFLVIWGLVLFLVQGTVVPFLANAKNMPLADLLLCFVCIIPCFASIKTSAVFAVCAGFLVDLFINYPTALSPLVYLSGVCLVYLIFGYFSNINVVTAAVCSIPAFLLRATVECAGVIFAGGKTQLLWSVLCRYFVYGVMINFACVLVIAFILTPFLKKMKFNS